MTDVLWVEFSPDREEHRRAVTALAGQGRPLADLLPLLVVFLAASTMSALIDNMAEDGGLLLVRFAPVVGVGMFLVGVRIAIRRSRGPIVWRVGAKGIEIDRPRRRLRVAWARMERVEETAEFFLLRLRTVGYYLPKRALAAGAADVLRLRMADALGERATLNLNGSG